LLIITLTLDEQTNKNLSCGNVLVDCIFKKEERKKRNLDSFHFRFAVEQMVDIRRMLSKEKASERLIANLAKRK